MIKKIILSAAIILILLMAACRKTPDYNPINPVSTTSEVVKESDESSEIIEDVEVTISEEQIDTVITGQNKMVKISGILKKPDRTDNLYSYTATLRDYTRYEANMMFLFGEYIDDVEDFNAVINGIPRVWKTIYLRDRNDYRATLGQTDYYECFDRTVALYESPYLELTVEEAVREAETIFERIGVADIEFYDSELEEGLVAYGERGPDRLRVNYYQQLHNIPVKVNLTTSIDEQGIWGRSFVEYDYYGVSGVSVCCLDYIKDYRIENCISYEEAIRILTEEIDNLNLNEETPICEVSFEYGVIKNVDGSFRAIPCWIFCVDNADMTKEAHDKYKPQDIVINAETGEVSYNICRYERYWWNYD